jgi:hypothetical protein
MTELILEDHTLERQSFKQKSGEIQFDIESGKKLLIKVEDEKVFDDKVPQGKKWRVWLTLKVEEVDA